MRASRTIGTALAVPALALALAACGGSNSSNERAASTATVSLDHLGGAGSVLVDSRGSALYTPDQESNGMIRCTGECLSFWIPLDASSPTKGAGVDGRLATLKRPDGTRQVTLGGKPLYRFVDDSPGKVTGDGFKDSFAGTRFTWHVVRAGGGKPPAQDQSRGSYGY